MPEPILLLRLEGPLQSWGVRSRWSRRDTGPEPSKSAIIGLLGCAKGIARSDWRSDMEIDRTLERWDNSLIFGVRIDRPGIIETDYHTVEGPHWQANGKIKKSTDGIHTEQTWRDYLHGAAFLVALAIKADYRDENTGLLKDLEEHLRFPKWPLYLGRKSCVPSRPIYERLADEYTNIEEALQREKWEFPRSKTAMPQMLEGWIECPDGEYERQDAIRLNQLRFYDFRRCRRIEIDTASLQGRAS